MLLPGKRATVRDPRAGVALLIVLGLLALLMITAVAFTILMRIERASASNLRHTSAARQMAKGGLAYAIAALNADIGTNRYPDWPDRLYTPANHSAEYPANRPKLHIPEDIFFSVDEEKFYADEVTEARVLSAETARYLPGARRYRAEIIRDNHENAYASPEWIPVTADGKIIGRYAYVILNTSGLLDANRVHTNTVAASARWMGAEPGELQLDPAVQRDVVRQNMAQPLKFALDRAKHGRYETLPELATLNTGVDGAALANFDVFSYAVPDLMPAKAAIPETQGLHDTLRTRTQGRRIDIGTEEKIKKQQNNILLAFQAAGLKDSATFSAAPAKWAYLGLLDYVDADNEPAGGNDEEKFARPATEAMPLFSQVMVNVKYEYDPNPNNEPDPDDGIVYAKHRMTYQYGALFAYPFEKPASPFKIEAKIICAIYSDEEVWLPLVPPMKADGFPQMITLSQEGVTGRPGETVFVVSEPVSYPPAGQPALKVPKVKGEFAAGHIEMVAGGATYSDKGVIRKVPVIDYDQESGILNSMLHLKADLKPWDNRWAQSGDGATYWCEAIDPRYNHLEGPEAWRASRDDAWSGDDETAPLEKLDANNILPGYIVFYPPGTPAGQPPPSPQPNSGNYGTLAEHMLTTPATLRDYFKIYTDGVRIGDDEASHCDPVTPQARAHVANGPLRSVGELGYLPIGLWLTINLYDHGHTIRNLSNISYKNNVLPSIGYHPVLDYFVVGDPNKGRRGLVNLSTPNPEVMGALFARLPVQSEVNTETQPPPKPEPRIKVPQDYKAADKSYNDAFRLFQPNPVTNKRECNDATELAQWVIDKGPFERLSDLGRFFQGTPQLGVASGDYTDPFPLAALKAAVGAGGVGEFEREALIRNLCNLVTLRGQTFTIILRADAFSPRFGMKGVKQGNVLATAMAVAQVWRDTEPMVTPSRNEQNKLVYTYNYPTFVQFFKILNE